MIREKVEMNKIKYFLILFLFPLPFVFLFLVVLYVCWIVILDSRRTFSMKLTIHLCVFSGLNVWKRATRVWWKLASGVLVSKVERVIIIMYGFFKRGAPVFNSTRVTICNGEYAYFINYVSLNRIRYLFSICGFKDLIFISRYYYDIIL